MCGSLLSLKIQTITLSLGRSKDCPCVEEHKHSHGRTSTKKYAVQHIIKNINRSEMAACTKTENVRYECSVQFNYLQQSRRTSVQVNLHLRQNNLWLDFVLLRVKKDKHSASRHLRTSLGRMATAEQSNASGSLPCTHNTLYTPSSIANYH